ncbi:MAG: lipoyl synthase [Deltaproteobacteria bacterium]|nr:lipoyl synthase [Deltaproteobacteria bacterium]
MIRDHLRKPPWLRKNIPTGPGVNKINGILQKTGLHTVCQEARCPNRVECYARAAATFLIMGPHCSRACTFCAVTAALPHPLNPAEPSLVAAAIKEMNLSFAVITSVTRDDLPDGGAAHFASVIKAVRDLVRDPGPAIKVEALVPDFQGDEAALEAVIEAGPAVLNHNLETISRLYGRVRPGADYDRSLKLLRQTRQKAPQQVTKSGIMVGLGESFPEILELFGHLREAGCDILTIGQYLQPSKDHHPVVRFVPPDEFRDYETEARRLGFKAVSAGPYVRSSYQAGELYRRALSPDPLGQDS